MAYKLRGGVIAPASKTCKNCPFEDKVCRFDQKQYGGFKGTKPQYISYRIITDSTEDNGAKEDTTTCFNFIESGLQRRMFEGQQLRSQGAEGEIVRIIGQEGSTYRARVRCGINSRGEIVRPQHEIREALKKGGHKIATDDQSQAIDWREVTYEATVPRYEETVNRVTGYQQSILQAELQAAEDHTEAEDQAWSAILAKQAEPNLKAK